MAVASEFSDIRQLYKLWTSTEFREQYPVFDVYNTGGIAQPGPDFVEFASKLVPSSFDNAKSKTEKLERKQELQRWVNCLYWQAMYYPNFRLPVKVKGAVVQAQFVGGHLWNYDVEGPKRSESGKQIMIIGKNPQRADEQQGRNFVDAQGDLLQRVLMRAGFSDSQLDEAYVTNVVKHGKLDPSSKNLAASWVRNCLPILQQEIAIVRPDFVLLLGSEPLKLLIHKSHNVSDMVGRVLNLDYRDVAGECRAAKVISAVHPSSIAHEPNRREQLEASCRDFCHLVNGTLSDRTETDTDHRVIDTSEELEAAVSEILAEPGDLILAVDCEWNGEAPYEANAYLRTIQISHKAKSAICVVLHRQNGVPAFDPELKSGRKVGRNDAGFKRAIAILKKLFFVTDRRVRVGGHFFRADLPWLMDAGLDLRELYAPPRVDAASRRQAAERIKYEGGFDTGLMFFAISETSELKLETLAMKYTSAPRYDTVKDAELTKYCKENKVTKKGIEGYGFLTDDTLHSYACLDGDSLVVLADGSTAKIRDLVRRRYSGKVKAVLDGQVVNASVTNWHRHDVRQQDWFKLVTPSSAYGRHGLLGPSFTPDHKIITKRGRIRVDELRVGEDSIATEEVVLSVEQLSVVLGCLLGDGGFIYRNRGGGVGFGFGQVNKRAEYAHWKAKALSTLCPKRLRSAADVVRYTTPFSRYLKQLSIEYPCHDSVEHGDRKAIISTKLLDDMGDIGLAVWYQDDGTIVRNSRTGIADSSRIYATIPAEESKIVVDWLSSRFGEGVRYNANNRFIQFTGPAFVALHAAIARYMHSSCSYKTPLIVSNWLPQQGSELFYDKITAVIPRGNTAKRRGRGVRYCLTVEGVGNFLTPVGFVSNCYDADVTRRLYDVAAGTADAPGLLSGDENGLDCWNAYYMSHRASLAFLEMEQTGIRIDRQRAIELINKFNDAYIDQLGRFREKIKWPGFNPKSVDQVREFLFGEDLGRLCNKTGRSVRLRPKHAVCKFEEPIKTSGKPSKDWGRVVDADETHIYRPSTDKETLGILGRTDSDIWALRQIRFTGQVLQTVLRLPDSKDSLADYLDPDDEIDDDLVFDGGILSHVRSDGRVHTRLSQTKETGRAGSSNPNMQNLCVDEQTEFLTSRGWVRGAELKESDIVGAFSVDNDEQFRIELVAPEMVHSYDYSGDMIGFNLPGTIDFLVTPNHRMVAWNTQYKKLHVSEAAEASLHKPLNVIGGGFLEPDPDCRNFYQAVIGEFILSEMAASGNLGHVGTAEKFLLQQAAFYPGQLADMHELYSHSWMRLFKKMNVESRLRVTEFVRLLFSYRRKQNKLTGKLADLVQACFSLSSRAMPAEFRGDTLKFHLKRRSGGKHAFAYRMDRAVKTTQSYSGKVYCVTVPSSFIVVRRNGCIGVTGNSKRREKDYKDILGKERYAPVRSMIIPEDGCVLVEADYKSAELAMIGWAAQCPQMIEDVRCNNLPEDDPRHADIHTRTAVTAFNLDLAGHRPTKHWIEEIIKRGDLRIGAKTVNFGIPYGRGDEATARTCREEGVAITLEQAAALRQGYFSRYPEIEAFLQLVADRATTIGWISGWARRYRRFAPTSDEKLQKAQGREACNFPIQNGVAEAMDIALDNLYRYRERRSVRYRIALQVHDAVILEVPKIYVAEVVHEVLPRCMDEWVHIWPKYLNGEVIPVDEPYHFGIDTEIFYRWGVKLTKEEKLELGV